ncbi:MAG: ABC transporter permease [Bacteroidetes bacterium]|nr:ABC transporter permease [Bacteroidota bacterium]
MLKNYFTIGWRNLAKDKMFSFINIAGLSLGLTCSMLIFLWIRDEYAIDAFHRDIDRIYTVTSVEYSGTEVTGGYDTPGLLAEELGKSIPEVERACSFSWSTFYSFSADDKKVKLNGTFAGPEFFSMFSYPILLGSKETALQSPESIALSRNMATSLFGSPEAAMNKAVRFENQTELKVTAVFEDIGDMASEKFDFLMTWELFLRREPWAKDWHNSGATTFVKLREHTDAAAVSAKIREFIKSYDKEYSSLDRLELGLQPFREKYLHSNFKNGHLDGGRIEYVQLFTVVAIFITLMACINFMNLSTAKSVRRAKEIGVRKVTGAVRGSLILQFMLESLLITTVAVVVSVVLVTAALPQFNAFTGKNIHSPIAELQFWGGLTALAALTALIAGSYPALLLSSFRPIAVLKNNFRNDSSSVAFRKTLVVVQFALAIIFSVGMIVISSQLNFIQNKNLGYQKNNLIYLPMEGYVATHYETFKDEALKLPGVTAITRMNQRPVEMENSTGAVEWEGKAPNTLPNFTHAAVGYDFIKTMQSELLLGRDFDEAFADSTNYLINETAWKIIGYKDPIGAPLTFWGRKGTIIGVVKDFHFNSFHVSIKPLIIRLKRGSQGYALIRTAPDKTHEALAALEKLHQRINPDFLFAHQFADEEYRYMYQREEMVQRLSTGFALVAIFISCLGLLGLVIFTAEQRTKEIGVRKVLGAKSRQIVTLLAGDFLSLVLVAIAIAAPVAYYAMTQWLTGFEYHVSVQWWMLAWAAGGAIAIASATISVHAVKAALANPVKSLRSE